MTSKLRSFLFNFTFFSFTALVLTVGLSALLLPRRVCLAVTRTWSRVTLWALRVFVGLQYQVEGLENVRLPCIIASKHQSTWDTVIFHHLFDDPAIVLKKELNRASLGAYVRRLKLIVVDRDAGRKAMVALLTQAKQALIENRPLVIFPEGTRSAPGEHGTYQKGVGALYRSLNVPVVPLALNSGCYWGRRAFDKKPGVITIRFLPPIEPGMDIDPFMERLEKDLETASQALLPSSQTDIYCQKEKVLKVHCKDS